ncbi:MAG: hypothetical protein HQK51_19775 [Oligoflexia bacterium]|nr:hypothetical protein [Oligoflexia bacterium]
MKQLLFLSLLLVSFSVHASFLSRTFNNLLLLAVSLNPQYTAINSIVNDLAGITADNAENVEAKIYFRKLYDNFLSVPFPDNTNKITVRNFTMATSQLFFKYSDILTPIAQQYYKQQTKKYLKFILACIYYSVSGSVETGEFLNSCGLTKDELERMRYVMKLTPDDRPSATRTLKNGKLLEHTIPDFSPALDLLPQLL